MRNYMKVSLAALSCVAIGYTVGRYSTPAKVETREVERVVYRDRVVKDQRRDATTRTKETRLPDGTKIKETVRDERTDTRSDATREAVSDKKMETKTQSRPDWRLGVVYYPTLPGFQGEAFGVNVERRIISEIYLGVSASTESRLGLVVSFGF